MFVDGMIMYVANPIDSTKKLLNIINEFGKMAGYKVNTHSGFFSFLFFFNFMSDLRLL